MPKSYRIIRMEPEMRVFIDNHALEIFSDCVNRGYTFQEALSCILLSGMDYGINSRK